MARILYVEACPVMGERAGVLLEQRGHSVRVVDCAERAMLCICNEGDYEALVLHLYLRGMDGAELCRWVEKWSSLKGILKIAFTWAGSPVSIDVSGGLPPWLPADHFIEDLKSAEELVEAVDGFLSKR